MTAVDLDALDAARAAAVREALRDELAGWPIGDGYYSTSIGIGEAGELADFLLAGSIAPLIAEARKARVTKALVLREIERQRRLGHVNDYGAERITAAALAAVDGGDGA